MVGIDSRRLRLIQLCLGLSMIGLLVIAVAFGLAISQYRDATRNKQVLSAAWTLSDTIVAMNRFQRVLATYELDDGTVAEAEVVQAYAALHDRVRSLSSGPDDPDTAAVVGDLGVAVEQLGPLVGLLPDPMAAVAARRHFESIAPRVMRAAEEANRRAADMTEMELVGVKTLQRVFVGIIVMILILAGALIVLLIRQNRLLATANAAVNGLVQNLAETTAQLEAANAAVAAANAELTEQNHRLVLSETEARLQSSRFAAALENMREGLSLFDPNGRLVVCNGRYAEMYGFDETAPLVGTPVRDILDYYEVAGIVDARTAERMRRTAHVRAPETVHFALADGRTYEVHRQPMPDGGWVATHEDITERRRAQARIEYLARHDGLTGLVNRAGFMELLAQELADAVAGDARLGVISFDLDRFKQVNDMYGHGAGDQILCEVARRAEAVIGDRGTVARFGGDEFVIAVAADDPERDLHAVATRLIAELGATFEVGGTIVEIGTSVGIAIAPEHGTDPFTLIRRADTALYEAKAAGRRVYCLFDFGMDQRLLERRALEADLKTALAEDRLELRYQPIVDLDTGSIVAAEALLRWNHPRFGWVSPDTFIPVAEESGLIVHLGAWVLAAACRDAASWPETVSLSVNLSAAQLKAPGLVPTIVRTLAATGLAAERLELEMTETVLFDEDSALDVMRSLRTLGVRFSLDDFGTGYSSLSYLRRFEFDQIKIDKSFLRDSPDRPDCEAIVHAIGALGRSLGIDTIAEGIETEGELAVVRSAGCRFGQGYLFGRPMAAADLADRLGPAAPEAASAVEAGDAPDAGGESAEAAGPEPAAPLLARAG